MFKRKIECVTDQAIRKLMYIRAGRYACLPGDIEKKAVGADICGGRCHVHLDNSPKLFPPVLNVLYSASIYCVLLMEEVKEKEREGLCTPDLVVTDVRYPSVRGNKPPKYIPKEGF